MCLRPLPGEVPADVRMRQALKVLLRRFGLQAVIIRDPDDYQRRAALAELGVSGGNQESQ